MSINFIKTIVIIAILIIGTLVLPIMRKNTKMPVFVAVGMFAAITAVARYKPEKTKNKQRETNKNSIKENSSLFK